MERVRHPILCYVGSLLSAFSTTHSLQNNVQMLACQGFICLMRYTLSLFIFTQPITWQQLNAQKHAGVVRPPNVRMGKKCDWSDLWLLVPDRVVWVSQKALIPLDFHAQRLVNESNQTGCSWQECDSNANNHTLQQWYAEVHLGTHQTSKTVVSNRAMEGREYAGFHSNQSRHQLILLMITSSIREEGTN